MSTRSPGVSTRGAAARGGSSHLAELGWQRELEHVRRRYPHLLGDVEPDVGKFRDLHEPETAVLGC
jgi:hypothetical protein